MSDNEYKCASCGGVFKKGWSDEECSAEARQIWGEIPKEQQVVICDDCFNRRTTKEIQEIGEEYKSNPPE